MSAVKRSAVRFLAALAVVVPAWWTHFHERKLYEGIENNPWLSACLVATAALLSAYSAPFLIDKIKGHKKDHEFQLTPRQLWDKRAKEALESPPNQHTNTDKEVVRYSLWNSLAHDGLGNKHCLLIASPGFGKTTFLAQVSERPDSGVLARYFIDWSNAGSLSLVTFVECIAAQLERRLGYTGVRRYFNQPVFSDAICQQLVALRAEEPHDNGAAQLAPRGVLKGILSATREVALRRGVTKPYYLFVDAVDELGNKDKSLRQALFNNDLWRHWPELQIVATSTRTEWPGEPPVGWTSIHLNDSSSEYQSKDMREFVLRIPEHKFALDQQELVRAELCDHVLNDFGLLSALVDQATQAEAGSLTVNWVHKQPRHIKEYFHDRFTSVWFQNSEPKQGEATPTARDYYHHAQKLVSLLLSQRSATSEDVLAAASPVAGKKNAIMTQETLRRMKPALNIRDSGDGIRSRRIKLLGGTTLLNWLTAAESGPPLKMEVDDFRRGVSSAHGHELWAAYTHRLTKLVPSQTTLEYVLDDGLFHCCKHAAHTFTLLESSPDEFHFGALNQALEVFDWAYDAVSPESPTKIAPSGTYRLRLPRLSVQLVDVIDQYEEYLKPEYKSLGIIPDELETLLEKLINLGFSEIAALATPLRVFLNMVLLNMPDDLTVTDKTVEKIMSIASSDQLMSRYALARAMAHLFRGNAALRGRILAVVNELRKSGKVDYDAAETAAYCGKFLWCSEFGGADTIGELHEEFGGELARSANFNFRMAYYESLIERACDPELKLKNKPLSRATPKNAKLWEPKWDYHRIDLAEAYGTWLLRPRSFQIDSRGTSISRDLIDEELECELFAKTHQDHVTIVCDRIRTVLSDLKMIDRDDTPEFVRLSANKYWLSDELLKSMQFWSRDIIQGELRIDQILDYLRPFVYHPIWEITEAAAGVVARIRESDSALGTEIIDRLSKEGFWQALYAALDAAYDSKGVDEDIESSKFAELVERHYYHEQFSRVRFLCAEETFLWYQDLVEAHGNASVNSEEGKRLFSEWFNTFKEPIKWWITDREDDELVDCALLYECFQFFKKLKKEHEHIAILNDLRRQVDELLKSTRITPLLTAGHLPSWWEMDNRDWLEELDRQKTLWDERNCAVKAMRIHTGGIGNVGGLAGPNNPTPLSDSQSKRSSLDRPS